MIRTDVYIASVSALCGEIYGKAYSGLTETRREKTDRIKTENGKRLSVGAEILLFYALKSSGFKDYRTPDLGYGEHGKPFLKNGEIYFNLSHSDGYVICAVSKNEIGCDIERITPVNLKIAERYFGENEQKDIFAKPTDSEKYDRFFRYWTLKESFMKATGLGFALPLDSFSINISKKVSVSQSKNAKEYDFYEFDGIKSYKCAVCVTGPSSVPVFHEVDIISAVNEVCK